eukprot:TRINITY_DN4252_c0_g1_i1.p1 TRINITY_DN4252_c0_g1~~TRINITY_DN4252_c0_g1_i1.p1  ORF type:complete len:137 (-),score=13.91 TRINITY_DN4252_c0_g1_i1:101-511(-)
MTVGGVSALGWQSAGEPPGELWCPHSGEDLHLYNNQLASLPESFGGITVRAKSFGAISVGEDLHLSNNTVMSLPKGFNSIALRGTLELKSCYGHIGPGAGRGEQAFVPERQGPGEEVSAAHLEGGINQGCHLDDLL